MRILAAAAIGVGLASPVLAQGALDLSCDEAYAAAIENPLLWERLEGFPAVIFTREQAFYTAAHQIQYDLWWQIAMNTEQSVFEDDSQQFAFIDDEEMLANGRTPLTGDERRALAELFFLMERMHQCLSADGPVLDPFQGINMVASWRAQYPYALRQRMRSYLEGFL